MPLNGRAAAQLVTLVAGVVDASNEGNGANQGSGKTFSSTLLSPVQVATVNGTLPNQDNFLLDGGNNLDEMTNVNDPYPMPDSVQEFSVQTSNYNAEFGQSAGAVVNIVTKSGGESFHGDLFEYLRNGFFNAENHFNLPRRPGHLSPSSIRRHHWRPGEDSAHLQRQDHAVLLRLSVHPHPHRHCGRLVHGSHRRRRRPRLQLHWGSLRRFQQPLHWHLQWLGHLQHGEPADLKSRITGVAWPYNHIPSRRLIRRRSPSRSISPSQPRIRVRERSATPCHYFSATQNYFNEDTARVDHQFGANDHMFARYFYDWYQQPAIYNPTNLAYGGLYSYTSYFQTRYQNALIAETHTFTPNILNNLVLNYQREVSQRGGPPGSFDITALGPSGSGLASLWQPNVGPYIALSVSGYMKVGSSASAIFERNNYTLNDDLHWVKGQHNFAFGGHVRAEQIRRHQRVQLLWRLHLRHWRHIPARGQRQCHGQFPAGLPVLARPGRIRRHQRPQQLPRPLRRGQLEGHSPPDPGLRRALGGFCSLAQ